MNLIAHCEACGRPLHEGDDYHFDKEGIVWICRACVEVEEDRLQEEFGFIAAGRGDGAGKFVQDAHERTSEHQA